MNKEITLAYIAGALDGDGSFSLAKCKGAVSPIYYPLVQLANAHKALIEFLFNELGGSVSLRTAYIAKDNCARKESHQWRLEKSAKCLPVLENLIPHLIIKKDRAELLRDYILENPFKRGSNRVDYSVVHQREATYLKMRSMNDHPDINGELLAKSKRVDTDDVLFWSYVAGLMDTDGSFSMKKEIRATGGSKSPVYTPTILLTMTDCRAVYHLMNNFVGGNMITVAAKTTSNGFCYRFSITSRDNSIKFLKKVIPYLLIKKDIAETLLMACESFKQMHGSAGVSIDQNNIRELNYNKIKAMNGVVKSSLMDLKLLPGNAEDNKAEGSNATVNVVSEKTSKEDAVL